MSDTQIFGKQISGAFTAGLIYVAIDITISACQGIGQTLHELDRATWDGMWFAQKLGWILLQAGGILGSAFLTLKAFNSNSSRK